MISEAAKAKAALDSLNQSAKAEGATETEAAAKAAVAHKTDTAAIDAERHALELLAVAAKAAQQWTAWGGRTDPGAYLADQAKLLEYKRLINIQNWLGFTTPQAAYAWRERERLQALDMNKAIWGGYTTPDQYLGYLQKQRSELASLNATMVERAQIYRDSASAALSYADALSGTHRSAGQLGESLDLTGVSQFQAALDGLPDVVTTQLDVDDAGAIGKLTAYISLLRAIPQEVDTSAVVIGGGVAGQPVPGAEVIPVSYGGPYQEQFAAIMSEVAALSRLRAEIPVSFELPSAAEVASFVSQIPMVGVTEPVHLAPSGGAVGVGPGPPEATITAWKLLSGAEAGAVQQAKLAAAAERAAGDAAAGDVPKLGALTAAWEKLSAAEKNAATGEHGLILPGGGGGAGQPPAPPAAAGGAEPPDDAAAKWLALAGAEKAAGDAAAGGAAKQGAANAALAATVPLIAKAGTGWFGLNAQLTLFAGVLGAGALGTVAAWHVILDAIIEALAILVPSIVTLAADLTAFGIAGYDAGKQVYDRLIAIHTASDALQQTLAPMTGQLEKLHDVVRPQVWQLYGDAIDVAHAKTGIFNQLAVQTGRVIDTLAARVTVFAESASKGLGTFFSVGNADLAKLGEIFHNLGSALMALIKVTTETHVDQIFLNFFVALSKLLDLITKLPTPILAAAVGLHAFWLWGGLAATVVANMLGPVRALALAMGGLDAAKVAGGAASLDKGASGATRLKAVLTDIVAGVGNLGSGLKSVGPALLAFFTNPVTLAVGLAAAVAVIAIKIATVKDATQAWIISMDGALAKSGVFTVVGKTLSDLAAVTQRLGQVQHGAAGNASELSAAQSDLSGKLTQELVHIGSISRAYGVDMPTALALLNAAGVKTSTLFTDQSKVWAAARQQVQGLVDGYKAMGQGMSEIQRDVSVQLVTSSDQLNAMDKLNQAWDKFQQITAGPFSGIVQVSQDLQGFWKDAAQAGASMTSMGANALILQKDFQGTYKDTETLFSALRSAEAVTGQGGFTSAVKAAVAALIPLAGSNKAAAAEISQLAQEAGGPATTNLAKLRDWTGKIHDPLHQLYKDSQDATVGVSNLDADAARLTTTLQQQLNPAMARAAFNAWGGQAAFNAFAADLAKFGPDSQVTIQAGTKVAAELLAVDKNAASAKAQFVGWGESMGLTAAQAGKLWAQVSKIPETRRLTIETDIQKTQFTLTQLQQQLKTATGPKKLKIEGEITDAQNKLKTLRGELGQTAAGADQIRRHLAKSATGADDLNKSLGHQGVLGTMRDLTTQGFGQIGDFFTKSLPAMFVQMGHLTSQGWSQMYTGFMRDAGSPILHFFAVSIPADAKSMGSGLAGDWKSFHTSFMSGFGTPVADFFSRGLPSDAKAMGSSLSGDWKSFRTGFMSEFGSPIGTFFSKTVPGWFTSMGSTWATHAKGMWKDFSGDVVGNIEHWMLNLLPGWNSEWATNWRTTGTGMWKSFDNSVVQPSGTFFTKTIPGWLNDEQRWWSSMDAANWKSFDNEIVGPLRTFFTKTIPGWFNDGSRWWDSAWSANMKSFQREIIDPFLTFFTKTVPGWFSDNGRWWDNLWSGNMKSFQHEIINPFDGFFTRTIPGWFNDLSRWWSNTWSGNMRDFNQHVLAPMEHWFSRSLPNAIENGFRDGINWVIENVINKTINFINNDILKHLPGSLSIHTIGRVAAGGDIGMPLRAAASGSVPGTGDEDGTHLIAMGGEYMLRKPARMALEASFGRGFMDHLNQADTWLGAGSRGSAATQQRRPGVNAGVAGYATGGQIASEAERFIGAPYVYGGTSPRGWDCSGFVQYVLEALGWHNVPRTSEEQYAWSKHESEPAVGGLVFAQFPGDNAAPGHVGFYLGNGRVLSARDPQSGTGVDALSSWRGYVYGYGDEPNATGLIGQAVSGITGLISEAWQGVEGLTDAAGTALGSLVSPLAKDISGGASALLKLAKQGAAAVFNGVWDHTVNPLTGVLDDGSSTTMPGAIVHGGADAIKRGIDNFMTGQDKQAQASAAAANAGGAPGSLGGPTSASAAQAQMYAKSQLGRYGWSSADMPYLIALWTQESDWNRLARNSSSGAYGIPQSLPPSKMGAAANPPESSASAQINWGLEYIKSVYGSPEQAEAHEQQHGWYAAGGQVPPAQYQAAGGVLGGDGASAMASGGLPGWGALNTAARNEQAAFWNLMSQRPPSSMPGWRRDEWGSWKKALEKQQVKTIGLNHRPPGDFQLLASDAAAPSKMTAGQWWNLATNLGYLQKEEEGTGIKGGINPPGTPADSGWVPWHYFRPQWQALLDRTRITNMRAAAARAQWAGQYSATAVGPTGASNKTDSPEWDTASGAMNTAVKDEQTAFWALAQSQLPSSAGMARHNTWVAWKKALDAQQVKTVGLNYHPPGAYQAISDRLTSPGTITAGQWSWFLRNMSYEAREEEGTGIKGGINPPGTPKDSGWVPWHYFRPQWQAALSAARSAQSKTGTAQKVWASLYGPGHLPSTPGRTGHGPPAGAALPSGMVNVAPEATMGGPAVPVFAGMETPDMGFASGGGLDEVASMFSGALNPGGVMLPVVVRHGIPAEVLRQLSGSGADSSRDYPRRLSEAGSSHYGPALNVEQMNIHNPLPQRPSDSIVNAGARLAHLAGRMN